MSEPWSDAARDEIYSELCNVLTAAGSRSELFLSRLALLLIERLGSPEAARQAIADAALEKTEPPSAP